MRSFLEPEAAPAPAYQMPSAVFDEIEFGLIVCDAPSEVVFANKAALDELASQRLLLCRGAGLSRAPGASGELELALQQAITRGRRSLVRLRRPGDELLVTVQPLADGEGGASRALLVLGRREPCSELGLELLAGSYGLTLAERRVLSALVREATPKEIARQHAVALSTVRTQISSIRAKLGTRNVEGLLLRAAQVPPMASALRMARPAPAPLLAAA
jgi:DNA-binding CsgD family transcriptional regulator